MSSTEPGTLVGVHHRCEERVPGTGPRPAWIAREERSGGVVALVATEPADPASACATARELIRTAARQLPPSE